MTTAAVAASAASASFADAARLSEVQGKER